MERNPAVQAAEEAVAWAKRPSMVNPAVTNYDALKLDVQRIARTTDAGTPVVTMISVPMAMAHWACLSRMLVRTSRPWHGASTRSTSRRSDSQAGTAWLQIMFADITGRHAPRRAAGGTRRARSRDDAQGLGPEAVDDRRDVDRLRDMAGRLPRRDICRELKRSSGAVKMAAKRLGLSLRCCRTRLVWCDECAGWRSAVDKNGRCRVCRMREQLAGREAAYVEVYASMTPRQRPPTTTRRPSAGTRPSSLGPRPKRRESVS